MLLNIFNAHRLGSRINPPLRKEKGEDRKERRQHVWDVHLLLGGVDLHLRNPRIPGAGLQNGGSGRHAEGAGCEKQGGPLQLSQFCQENISTDQSGTFVVPIVGK